MDAEKLKQRGNALIQRYDAEIAQPGELDWSAQAGLGTEALSILRDALDVLPSDAAQASAVPVELLGVADELKNGDGFWRTCSGCHESEVGRPVGHYPFSEVLNCDLGSGCRECGGIGAVWDDADYGAMADAWDAQEIAREQAEEAQAPIDYDRVVQICEAHGIGLPVECVEMVVEIIRHAAPVAPAAAAPIDTWELIREINGGGALPITASFQQRVQPWMMECFGAEISADRAERNHRFFEEATELVQACGMTASEAHQLVDYTFGRPVGEPHQEVGGVMVTLAALCLANGLDMHADGETELARISLPETVAKIRAKQAAKPKHSPLPEPARVVSEDRSDALCDMHYSRGLQAGFSLGQMDDNEGLRKGVESREGYLKVLRETPRASQLGAPMSAAARDVLAERVRQVSEEGRTPAHDDRNDFGQMASAAACYAITHRWTRIDVPPPHWPCDWARGWWKPTTPRRDLVKAGALILAEIERIDRANATRPAKSHCQNGGDVCLAGNRDGVCCPEDSCDIDDGTRRNPIDKGGEA